ncbi:MAG: DUF362 domain-containing protein [Theionarchaea archaeon]|nr:DUF362 domain-containing protein [Theionarchaea archaeon]MBU7001649.1 DUF362 domain-containing protein [Theionarchaea archaeon]MBU7021003.1 DUF362 domain-containing protein [Theionarchaea archaeon]MBU7034358.1 DUF362 domain-containing protein [Theionarchaea archaeon]MBU7041583.1 DUF362 domain-containing protein [Theionarchaea archaeon]
MTSRVAVVDSKEDVDKAFRKAVALIGGLDDLNTGENPVTVKVGIFNHKEGHHHTNPEVVNAIAGWFNRAPVIYVAESDNYKGKALDRLQKFKEVFSERVVPFDLSRDPEMRPVTIAHESLEFSHVLFDPHILVSTHVLRKAQVGSVLKNLLGLVPDREKARFHEKLTDALLDAYEAVGGIDLAVLDGTHMFVETAEGESREIETNVLVVGRDAVAVEAVGASLCGLNPLEVPVIQEAIRRGLGEGDIQKIEIVGDIEWARESCTV